jgi:hypothetical protein
MVLADLLLEEKEFGVSADAEEESDVPVKLMIFCKRVLDSESVLEDDTQEVAEDSGFPDWFAAEADEKTAFVDEE